MWNYVQMMTCLLSPCIGVTEGQDGHVDPFGPGRRGFVLMALARNGMACLGAKFLAEISTHFEAGLQQSTLNLGETWWMKHVVRVLHIFCLGTVFVGRMVVTTSIS